MNYRHAFHAGNFADVLKHAILCRLLVHLCRKAAAFRAIDTHAGSGLYDLSGPEAERTGEWRGGIGLLTTIRDEAARTLLAPYLDAVAALNPANELTCYPGSPALVRAFLRSQDRLIACELEPAAAAALAAAFHGDRRIKTLALDGWTALSAFVPPKERRGLVLVDPPFEQPGEFERLARGLAIAHRKWATGTYLLWYPIKQLKDATDFAHALTRLGIAKILRAELTVGTVAEGSPLAATGVIVVNPPWPLHDELAVMLPALAAGLSNDKDRGFRLDWISGEG
jgi:23S rRNA (adenine2030-N6)-methyltransferase